MIFWKYTKGFNDSNSSGKGPLWSFIYYQFDNSSSGDLAATFARIPSIKISRTNTDISGHSEVDCGHIITERATGQSIATAFDFLNNLGVGGALSVTGTTYCGGLLTAHSGLASDDDATFNDHCWITSNNHLYFNSNGSNGGRIHYDGAFYITSLGGNVTISSASTSEAIYLKQSTTTRVLIDSNGLNTTGRIYASDYIEARYRCEAQYFNATSDRRAKTNIQPLLIDALDLVRKTKLYSFKYKETDTPSIGIIAQDVQDVNINGFKLVDNEEATGKDLDYMTIHESKLTYILWKAVQEQQKMIEDLQRQLSELKKN